MSPINALGSWLPAPSAPPSLPSQRLGQVDPAVGGLLRAGQAQPGVGIVEAVSKAQAHRHHAALQPDGQIAVVSKGWQKGALGRHTAAAREEHCCASKLAVPTMSTKHVQAQLLPRQPSPRQRYWAETHRRTMRGLLAALKLIMEWSERAYRSPSKSLPSSVSCSTHGSAAGEQGPLEGQQCITGQHCTKQ